jgi:hypothetical protein
MASGRRVRFPVAYPSGGASREELAEFRAKK